MWHLTWPNSEVTNEFNKEKEISEHGVFKVIELPQLTYIKIKLIDELLGMHRLGWIKSKRLDAFGNMIACESSNCGGYRLEAELCIRPNSYSKPDF